MRRFVWLLLGIGIWVSLAVSCVPITPEPPDETPPTEQQPEFPPYISQGTIVSNTIEVMSEQGEPVTVDAIYVEKQVLLSGPPDGIDAVINSANEQLGETLDGPRLWWDRAAGDFIGELDGIEYRRYHFEPKVEEATAISIVLAEIARAAVNTSNTSVLGDLNLAVTAKTACPDVLASSGHGEASPGHGEASPLTGTGAPFPYPSSNPPLNTYFWQQWALTDVISGGIGLSDGTKRRPGLPGDGANVHITILDTSPFPASAVVPAVGTNAILPTFALTVVHPIPINLTIPPGLGCLTGPDISDHGVFVAGLAHAVAPNSSYKLVRVLNNQGVGDLGGIVSGLTNNALSPNDVLPDVVNLSLGIARLAPLNSEDQVKVGQLRGVFQSFENRSDVVTVAAAGNHANGNPPYRDPQLPAYYAAGWNGAPAAPAFSKVIAAAASMYMRDRTFYSHKGTVAAPGGGDDDHNCTDVGVGAMSGCWDQARDFLVSITTTTSTSGALTYGLGYWEGTSFATPLISGMAAVFFPGKTSAQAATTVKAGVCPPPPTPVALPVLGTGIMCFP